MRELSDEESVEISGGEEHVCDDHDHNHDYGHSSIDVWAHYINQIPDW